MYPKTSLTCPKHLLKYRPKIRPKPPKHLPEKSTNQNCFLGSCSTPKQLPKCLLGQPPKPPNYVPNMCQTYPQSPFLRPPKHVPNTSQTYQQLQVCLEGVGLAMSSLSFTSLLDRDLATWIPSATKSGGSESCKPLWALQILQDLLIMCSMVCVKCALWHVYT